VLALFVVISQFSEFPVELNWGLLWVPVAILLQTVLLVGLGLLVAPLCVIWNDLERTTKLILRALFYASPVIYGVEDLPGVFETLAAFNPLAGIFALYRVGFFAEEWDPWVIGIGAVMCLLFLALGLLTFRRLERPVLKEL
jgi:ABC-2 type transport system permease protein